MDPGQAGGAELGGPTRACDDRREIATAGTPDARQARHRYSAGPPPADPGIVHQHDSPFYRRHLRQRHGRGAGGRSRRGHRLGECRERLLVAGNPPQQGRDEALERECAGRGDKAHAGRDRPEDERRGREDEAAESRPDRAAEAPGQGVDREVAAAKVRRADVGDERLMGRAVKALADPEQAGGEREGEEGRGRVQPRARPSTISQAIAQSTGMIASARIRRRPSIQRASGSCTITITAVLTAKTTPISRSLTPPWSRANCGNSVDQRVAGGDEQEVQQPQPAEGPVPEHGTIGRPRVLPRPLGAGIVDEGERDDVAEERERVQQEEQR